MDADGVCYWTECPLKKSCRKDENGNIKTLKCITNRAKERYKNDLVKMAFLHAAI